MKELFNKQSILAILGMACMWPALHNQILYPLTLLFHKEGAPSSYWLYIVFVIAIVVTLAILFAIRHRTQLFSNTAGFLSIGAIGVVGIALVALVTFENAVSIVLVVAGLIFYAVYVPIYFIFWSIQVADKCENVPLAIMISYALFAGVSALRIAIGFHVAYLSIGFTLFSLVFAAFVKPSGIGVKTTGVDSLKVLPLNIIVPSFIFVLMCVGVIAFLNPAIAAIDYPPSHRMYMYVAVFFVSLLLAALYHVGEERKYRASLTAFVILSMVCVACIAVSGIGRSIIEQIGNYPAIGARILLEAFIWALVVSAIRTKHIGAILPAIIYIVVILCIPNVLLATVLDMDYFKDASSVSTLALSLVCSLIVIVVSNFIMAKFLLNPKAAEGSDVKSAPENSLDEAFEKARATFELSERQMDIVRLAYKNWTSSRIGEELYISEGTVKTHLKTIYKKANVHSKQELIDVIDAFKDR